MTFASDYPFWQTLAQKRASKLVAQGLIKRDANGTYAVSPDLSGKLGVLSPADLEGQLNAPIAAWAPLDKSNSIFQAVRAGQFIDAARAQWQAMGGAASTLGLPIDADPWPEFTGGTSARLNFRGGSIDVGDLNNLTTLSATQGPTATLWFVGMECLHKAYGPGDDEISLSHGVYVPSTGDIKTMRHDWDGIGEPDERIRTANALIYSGPPAALAISYSAVEVDTGDKADRLEGCLRDALNAGKDKLTGGAKPSDWDGMPEDLEASGDIFFDWLWSLLVDAIVDLFGLPDDELGSGVFSITSAECLTQPPIQVATHAPDPQTIEYTHRVEVVEPGGGADAARYAFYFKYVVG